MLICSGMLSSSNGVWGRLVNCVFSLCAPWEFDFFVQSRFKHIPVKPWMLYVLIPCSKRPMNLLTHVVTLTPFFCPFTTALSWKSSKTTRTAVWFLPLSLLSPYPWVCLHWDLWMWRWSILATQDDSQDQRFGHLPSESSLGDALSALKDLWLSLLHTGDQPHFGKISPQYLQGELSWRIPCSLSQGLSSSPAGLELITYAHNPWLVHVIHQPGPRPLAPESPQLTCLLGGSWVAMATLIFSWQLGFSHGAKSLFSLCVSFLSVVLRPPLFVCFSIYGFLSLFSWFNCSHAELGNWLYFVTFGGLRSALLYLWGWDSPSLQTVAPIYCRPNL